MLQMDGSDQIAVQMLHDEVAYADLGTVTPHLMITRPRVTVVKFTRRRTKVVVAQDWSNWSWATAPPLRSAA